jgi:hypothetical protein
VGAVPRAFERGYKIFIALALEFFLHRFEACNARRDFGPCACRTLTLFDHCPSFLILIRVSPALAVEIGA